MSDNYLVQQIADMRAEIAELRNGRVTHKAAQVTATNAALSTFTAILPTGETLAGITAPPQFLPTPGDWVNLTMEGATPRYEPARISPGAFGSNVEVTQTNGIKILGVDPDGHVEEFGRLGSTSDVLTIGSATIDETGRTSLPALDLDQMPTIAGRSLLDIIDERGGNITYGKWDFGVGRATTTEVGLFEVSWKMKPGHAVQVDLNGQLAHSVTGGSAAAYLRGSAHATAPPTPTVSSTELARWAYPIAVGGYEVKVTGGIRFGYNAYLPAGVPWGTPYVFRALLSVRNLAGGGQVSAFGSWNLYVDDAGLELHNVAVDSIGGGSLASGTAPAPPPTNPVYTRETAYLAEWTMAYTGNGAQRGYGEMYQGQSPYYPAGGDHRSMVRFHPAMTTEVTGAVVNSARVGLYANHWHYAGGGTALIGIHTYDSPPATFVAAGIVATVAGWPRGAWREFYLPYDALVALANGTFRGITLGPSGSTDPIYYGVFGSAGTDARPYIYVNYTK